ncbi:MAG: M3 family metallopeptidase [Mariprofundus sp.]
MTIPSISDNPLIKGISADLPLFDQIKPEHILPALEFALTKARQQVTLLTALKDPAWDTLMLPLESIDEMLGRVWGPVTHLNGVCDSDEMRPVYQQGVALMSAWHTELAQNELLYAAMRNLRNRQDFPMLSRERQQVIEHALRDFRLSGAELEGDARLRFKAIMMRLSELSTAFSQHVLDATQAFELHITDAADIKGLPESVAAAAAQRAEQKEKSGWLITLDAPSYMPFMQYAENSLLRQQLYTALVSRASEGELDNGPLITEMLSLKLEAATLLGFSNYAEYSLATKMAGSVDEVTSFLRELATKSKAYARQDLEKLQAFAAQELGLKELKAWDIGFVSEKLRLQTYAVSQEELKPYFPEQSVINGMFALVERLYGIAIRPNNAAARWHAAVRYYEVFNADNEKIAAFYLDPYARAHKRGGAWMDECITRWQRPDGALQLPVAYLVCNFDAPVGDKPALWTHDEVTTLFHEFGHGLNHMLTSMSELGVSGIRGVPWDAVELPSQFMENFCWEKEVVDMFARHYQTGETMPDALFGRMLAAKNFQSGMQMLRQVEFSLFDILLHSAFNPDGKQSVHGLLDQVRDEIAVLVPPAFNRFENSFSHIFAGGYAAGYYSYKWAEVLSADAFAAFEEEGILNSDTAARFRGHILAIGGSADIMESFSAFRGRKPNVEALLRHSGLAPQATTHG